MGARLPGQLPPSVQETARDRRQGSPSCPDNCLLLGSVAKVNPSPGTVSGDKSVFPKATLLFCYLILDWWWGPGNPQFHSFPLPSFPSLMPLSPPQAQAAPHPLRGHVGNGSPAQGPSPTTARARHPVLAPGNQPGTGWFSEQKQDLGARLPGDGSETPKLPLPSSLVL